MREESYIIDTLQAVLLFFDGKPWTEEKHVQWYMLTGKSEVTTKALCDTVREVLREEGYE